ncbi:MAG: hypothetical protein CMI01_00625 [Oceanospirillaceae bacterium]|nr:hypothetical protein [Oceanospirillaceae bacterium]
MTYKQLAFIHLGLIIPAIVLGAGLLLAKKGTDRHRLAGRLYMVLMFSTALVSLWMPAHVGPQVLFHFGYIHLLSLLTLVTVPLAWWGIRQGNLRLHRNAMIGLFTGGILVAGTFALMPGRMLNSWIF